MKNFQKLIQEQFDRMCQTGKLFRSKITGQQVWEKYINAFPKEHNPIFRDPSSSTHNCNHCKNFIRRYGNIVSINNDGRIESIFSNITTHIEYEISTTLCNDTIISAPIENVFFETFNELNSLPYETCKKEQPTFMLGVVRNTKRYTKEEAELYGGVKANEVVRFNHLNLKLPSQFVNQTGKSVEAIMATYRDKYSVFERAMREIPLDTLRLVKDLINQGSLLDGTAHLHAIEEFMGYKKVELYSDEWLWEQTYNMDERVAKFRNTLVGVLCTELAEGKELNSACQSWNRRVDPANYHKATAPITQKQIKEAQIFVEENGYTDSFNRRLATMDDIKASDILHVNEGDGSIKKVSIFDNVKSTSTRHKRAEFDKLQEVSIETFMKDILSEVSMEVYLENRMQNNLCVLTQSINDDCKPMFKWSNNYSWTFNGNLAGKSQIRDNVAAAGGKVNGFMRFSIQWNDEDTKGIVDFDAHCRTPFSEISFNQMQCHTTKGELDIDMIDPSKVGVENIYWMSKSNIADGKYVFFNRNYNDRSNTGFKAEIEINGETYNYHKTGDVRGDVRVATVIVKDGQFTIEHHLPETNSSKEYWGLKTNNFHKVNLTCLSPNHWGDNKSGNLHYLFMLDKCKSEGSIRSFHNENLIPELLTHRKVMEVLGATNMIEPTGKHLAGLGFNSTVKDELIVKLTGSFKRMIKIKF